MSCCGKFFLKINQYWSGGDDSLTPARVAVSAYVLYIMLPNIWLVSFCFSSSFVTLMNNVGRHYRLSTISIILRCVKGRFVPSNNKIENYQVILQRDISRNCERWYGNSNLLWTFGTFKGSFITVMILKN